MCVNLLLLGIKRGILARFICRNVFVAFDSGAPQKPPLFIRQRKRPVTAGSDLSRRAGTATALPLKLNSVEINITVKALSQSVRAPPVERSSLEFNGDVLFKDASHLEIGVRLVYSYGIIISAD